MNAEARTERIRGNHVYGPGRPNAEADLNLLLRAAADLFFPSTCLACAERAVQEIGAGGVCEPCWKEIPEPASPRCGVCDEPLFATDTPLCGRCLLDPPEFRRLAASAAYRGPARAILLAFKFRGADYLAPHLARWMASRLETETPADAVVAVPATSGQRRRRDHAADLLAAAVAREIGLPLRSECLEKVRRTQRQSTLSLEDRAENVRRAFQSRRPTPRRVLLVDDIATSGATARACARALARGGAETVDVWCFARAARQDELAGAES